MPQKRIEYDSALPVIIWFVLMMCWDAAIRDAENASRSPVCRPSFSCKKEIATKTHKGLKRICLCEFCAFLWLKILFRDNRPRFRWVTHEAQRIPQNPHLKFSVVWLSQRRTRLKRFWIQRTRRAGRFRFVGGNGDQYRRYTLSFDSALDRDDRPMA